MKKIIIAGAGDGGLLLANLLIAKGFQVTVFEKNARETISYDWHDDVDCNTFKEAGISMDSLDYHLKQDWSFIMYGSDNITKISIPDNEKDISIHRRSLANKLIDNAKGVEFFFSNEVLAPIVKGNYIVGVETKEGDFYADLVIDNCGHNSPLRSKLPIEFGIENHFAKEDVFHVYRAFLSRNNNLAPSVHTNKAYLRHLGRKGISWALDKHDEVDVLIGSVGSITKDEIEEGLLDLAKDNPIIGETRKMERICIIPVRRPLERMVCNGYVALGDSAFMTIPMLGSGIRTSLRSAVVLAEIIESGGNDFSAEVLWKYQVKVYRDFLYQHFAVDVMKRWLLNASLEDIGFISKNKLVDAKEMADIATGHPYTPSFFAMLQKLKIGYRNPKLLLALSYTLLKGKRAMRIAKSIPKSWNVRKISVWERRAKKIFT